MVEYFHVSRELVLPHHRSPIHLEVDFQQLFGVLCSNIQACFDEVKLGNWVRNVLHEVNLLLFLVLSCFVEIILLVLLLVIFLGFDLSHQPVLSQLKDRHLLFGLHRAWMVLCALIDRLSRSVKSGQLESLLMNNVLFDVDLIHLLQVLEVLLPLLLLD